MILCKKGNKAKPKTVQINWVHLFVRTINDLPSEIVKEQSWPSGCTFMTLSVSRDCGVYSWSTTTSSIPLVMGFKIQPTVVAYNKLIVCLASSSVLQIQQAKLEILVDFWNVRYLFSSSWHVVLFIFLSLSLSCVKYWHNFTDFYSTIYL